MSDKQVTTKPLGETTVWCDCGAPNPSWHGDRCGRRVLCCDNCYERVALIACADALKKLWGVHRDLAKSNPGFLGRLALQDYATYNEAMGEVPEALQLLTESKLS